MGYVRPILKTITYEVMQFIYPNCCYICKQSLENESLLCGDCEAQIYLYELKEHCRFCFQYLEEKHCLYCKKHFSQLEKLSLFNPTETMVSMWKKYQKNKEKKISMFFASFACVQYYKRYDFLPDEVLGTGPLAKDPIVKNFIKITKLSPPSTKRRLLIFSLFPIAEKESGTFSSSVDQVVNLALFGHSI